MEAAAEEGDVRRAEDLTGHAVDLISVHRLVGAHLEDEREEPLVQRPR
jgi:hypothetical protein